MARQTIEIEVPEGKKAVWDEKHKRIEFVAVNHMEDIKSVDDALSYLQRNNLCDDLIEEFRCTVRGSYSETVCKYRIVVAALTNAENRHLTTGETWFPIVQFCRPKDVKNCYGDKIIGRIESDGQEYVVVGGRAGRGAYAGLGAFNSNNGVSYSWTTFGFRSVSSKEIAEYISEQFGKLLFEVHYGGANCSWRWIK